MNAEQRKTVVRVHLELAWADLARRVERGWIDQEFSPLGLQRHVDAVQRRVSAEGHSSRPTAMIIGCRYLLTVDALAEEYFAPTAEARPANCNGEARA